MAKKDLGKKVTLKKEQKFKVGDLHTHMPKVLKKIWTQWAKLNPKTKFYEKRGR